MRWIIFFLVFCVFSCSEINNRWDSHYHEDLKYLLIADDGLKIVAFGEDYHYILDDKLAVVKKLLFSSHRYLLEIDTSKTLVAIDKDNNIDVYFEVKNAANALPKDSEQFFKAMQFDSVCENKILKIRLKGKRYEASHHISQYVKSLKTKYKVEMRYKINEDEKMAKPLMTPLIMAINTIMSLDDALLIPFGLEDEN